MDLTLHQDSYAQDERDWLGSQHGTDMIGTHTIDVTAFTAGTHYPNGYLNSGIVLAKRTSDGKLVPYANGGSGGAGTAHSILFTQTRVVPLGSTTASANVQVPTFRHGKVVVAKLPANSGIDATAQGQLTQILFI